MNSSSSKPQTSNFFNQLFYGTTNNEHTLRSTDMLSVNSMLRRQSVSALYHAEDNDLMAWEGMTLTKAMMAGSLAGVTEHACMFPVDTIKTRMQISNVPGAPTYTNVWRAIGDITRTEGFSRLYRGLPAVALAAIPSHAAYFGTFELMKTKLGASRSSHTPVANALSGISATLAHDALATPMDVVKQRLQVYGSQHSSVMQCIRHVFKHEGAIAFYHSYPTTVFLNVPYMVVHFTTYEGMHTALHGTTIDDTPLADILSGALAGALGALISNPLDVVKTRLQTQEVSVREQRLGPVAMVRRMWAEEGLRSFTKGASARVTMFIPSAAICWTVYEGLKRVLVPNYKLHGHGHGHGHDHDHASDSSLGNL